MLCAYNHLVQRIKEKIKVLCFLPVTTESDDWRSDTQRALRPKSLYHSFKIWKLYLSLNKQNYKILNFSGLEVTIIKVKSRKYIWHTEIEPGPPALMSSTIATRNLPSGLWSLKSRKCVDQFQRDDQKWLVFFLYKFCQE